MDIIRIIFTDEDVKSMVDDYNAENRGSCILSEADILAGRDDDCEAHDHEPSDVEYLTHEVAIARADEWGKHIASTASALCDEQLLSAITTGTP